MKFTKTTWAAVGAALILAACGGGGGDGNQTPKVSIKSVKVFGDSLTDSGTFNAALGNRIFSVQGATHQIWTERIASAYGIPSLCNAYQFTGTGSMFIPNPTTTGCTSYGVGKGKIHNPIANGGANLPFSIVKQMTDAGAAIGTYSATDLVLIDGGGNDTADLVAKYLGTAAPGGAGAYSSFLKEVLDTTLVDNTLLTGPAGFASIGGTYMTAVADVFFDAIQSQILNKGAQHVLILNMPNIVVTPYVQAVLDQVGTANGAPARAQAEGLFRSWMVAFNTRLSARASGINSVVVVDFYTSMDDEVKHPEQYGLTNVTTPACPATGSSAGIPTYTFSTCTDTALSALTPPVGATGGANWWKTYAFADNFHPTPYGYQLLAQLASKSLVFAGWL